MTSSRLNSLDQALDIAGSLIQSQSLTLSDEPAGLGSAISGQSGLAASITAWDGTSATVDGLTGMTEASVGNFLTISLANSGTNNGTFLIDGYVSDQSVKVLNTSAVAPDLNNGNIHWSERAPYSLQDDLNFARTDRAAIKGVDYYAAIPTYTRPSDTTTQVPANLSNISSKTLDAHAWVVNRRFPAVPVAENDGYVKITDSTNLHHATASNKTGVPILDGADAGKLEALYVEIIDPDTENYLIAKGGIADGYRIFGYTRAGTSGVSPDSVEVEFRAVPLGAALSSSIAYSWDAYQPTTVDLYYGYREQADNLTETAFRTTLVNGLFADATTAAEVSDILTTIGTSPGDTSLAGLLTNTGIYYPFYNLPDATPSVVEALNTLNAQIGSRDYTGTLLTDGYTITASLQQLSNAIEAASIVRTIQRVSSEISAGTPVTIPGGQTYTLDLTNNGKNLYVYTRGVLRDPGTVITGDDYQEVDPTTIKFFYKIAKNDHINYFILQ
jgi:hypothetical protein